MKNLLFFVILLFIIPGCGGGGDGNGGNSQNPQPIPIASIDIFANQTILYEGETQQLTANPKDSFGDPIIDRTIAWNSSDTSKLMISSTGMVAALSEGKSLITASAEGKSASIEISVLKVLTPEQTVTSMILNSTVKYLSEGEQFQFMASAFNGGGELVDDVNIEWSSLNDDVASISSTGIANAISVGKTTIKAKVGSVESVVAIEVFGNYDYELLFSRADIGFYHELYSLDMNDPIAQPSAVFAKGKRVSHATTSPDGGQIAFVVYGGGPTSWESVIYVVNRDSTNVRRLTYTEARHDEPAWSPDGSRIAFTRQVFGEGADVWMMNIGGSEEVNITDDLGIGNFRSPSWSPKLNDIEYRIVFSGEINGETHLWSMRDDGTNKVQLTFDAQTINTEPDWSPDGKSIVFVRSGPALFGDLFIISSQGGLATNLTGFNILPYFQKSPKWSPDGRLVAFASTHDGSTTSQIWTVWADGTKLVKRTDLDEDHVHPNWKVL